MAEEGPWSVGGFLSYYSTDDERRAVGTTVGLDDDLGLAGTLGYRFSDTWEWRFIVSQWDLGHTANGYGRLTGFTISTMTIFTACWASKVPTSPAPTTGYSIWVWASVGKLPSRCTLPVRRWPTNRSKESYLDFGFNVGVTYFFGSTEPAYKPTPAPTTSAPAPQAPVDSDRDGIYDDRDQCANTPVEDAVDSKGCSRYTMADETVRLSINFANNDDRVADSLHG